MVGRKESLIFLEPDALGLQGLTMEDK